ncbi:MAG: IS3 family transposase [Rhodobacteraceae bacterium]|nr:IS3 family transposase [Paracoccaceae bacterium]
MSRFSLGRYNRAIKDAELRPHIQRAFDANWQVYGVRKVWRQLRREGFDVARCTVVWLMKAMSNQGVRLVQQPSPAQTHREHPTHRSRSNLLRRFGNGTHGRVTNRNQPPANPAPFKSSCEFLSEPSPDSRTRWSLPCMFRRSIATLAEMALLAYFNNAEPSCGANSVSSHSISTIKSVSCMPSEVNWVSKIIAS